MTPKKLSDSEKQDIAASYGEGGVTMASLARTYGVSPSTISRVLRQAEAEQGPPSKASKGKVAKKSAKAVTKKTSARNETSAPPSPAPEPTPESSQVKTKRTRKRSSAKADKSEVDIPDDISPDNERNGSASGTDSSDSAAEGESSRRRVRRRSSSPSLAVEEDRDGGQLEIVVANDVASDDDDEPQEFSEVVEVQASDNGEDLGSDNSNLELDDEDLDDDLSLDDDYGDDDDDEEEDDDDDDGIDERGSLEGNPEQPLEVSPFVNASLPNPCYLVVDRSAELITRPLKDFRDLGQIPEDEANLKTLPVFDNHRIARRFSARNQRVIKVPDSTVFMKTGAYLQAKKITRLLVDGRVYSL
ncbi:MAG: transposase [Cyanophyceae cyanobacterium]